MNKVICNLYKVQFKGGFTLRLASNQLWDRVGGVGASAPSTIFLWNKQPRVVIVPLFDTGHFLDPNPTRLGKLSHTLTRDPTRPRSGISLYSQHLICILTTLA